MGEILCSTAGLCEENAVAQCANVLAKEIEKEEMAGTVRSLADICHVMEFMEGQTDWGTFVAEADV